jgi:hypothetical protein
VPSSGGPDYCVVRVAEGDRKRIFNTLLLAAGFFILIWCRPEGK